MWVLLLFVKIWKLWQRGSLAKVKQLVAVPGLEPRPCGSSTLISPTEIYICRWERRAGLYLIPPCPMNHFSSINQRKNCKASETPTSFPFILSPTSVPEEPCLRRHLNHSVWLSYARASLQGKSDSIKAPQGVKSHLERLGKGRRIKQNQSQGQG